MVVSRSTILNFVRIAPMLVLSLGLRPHSHLTIARSFFSNLAMSVFLRAQHSLTYSMALLTQLPCTLFPMLSDKLLHESTGSNCLNFLQAAFILVILWQPRSHHHHRWYHLGSRKGYHFKVLLTGYDMITQPAVHWASCI